MKWFLSGSRDKFYTGYLSKSYLQGGRIRERVKLSILRQNCEVVLLWLIYHGPRAALAEAVLWSSLHLMEE